MKILFAAVEGAPFFKVGGLGDVAYALPRQLAQDGEDIRVVLPFYQDMPQEYRAQLQDVFHFEVAVGWRQQYCGVKTLQLGQVQYYFIDNLYYFGRPGVYGYEDDGERFAFFNLAILEMLEKINFIPDVIHVNDWHTAMIPVLLKDKYQWITAYQSIKTILTIHNLQFQGCFDPVVLGDLFGIGQQLFNEEGFKYYDCVNYLKGGINLADFVTTVSPTYAQEIKTPAFGEHLEGVLQKKGKRLMGILNGIDLDLYNPERDAALAATYSTADLTGKARCKAALQQKLHLPVVPDVPLLGLVSRLTKQKGIDLLLAQLEEMLQENLQLVVLGTGEPEFEQGLKWFAGLNPGKMSFQPLFDESLARQIYAGSDLFLMPSAFEPCGLSQLMAERYGSLPLVHEVGGLKDTVQPYNQFTQKGNGFSFATYQPAVLLKIVKIATQLYQKEPVIWQKLIKNAMNQDFSWEKSAQQYQDLYRQIQ